MLSRCSPLGADRKHCIQPAVSSCIDDYVVHGTIPSEVKTQSLGRLRRDRRLQLSTAAISTSHCCSLRLSLRSRLPPRLGRCSSSPSPLHPRATLNRRGRGGPLPWITPRLRCGLTSRTPLALLLLLQEPFQCLGRLGGLSIGGCKGRQGTQTRGSLVPSQWDGAAAAGGLRASSCRLGEESRRGVRPTLGGQFAAELG